MLCGTQARLQADVAPTSKDTLDNVTILKDTIQKDSVDPETGRPFFDPTLMRRGALWPSKNVFKMVPVSERATDAANVQRLRNKFKRDVLKHDFEAAPKTRL